MSNISFERYYFVLYDSYLISKMSKMDLSFFANKLFICLYVCIYIYVCTCVYIRLYLFARMSVFQVKTFSMNKDKFCITSHI